MASHGYKSIGTIAIHVGQEPDKETGAVVPPISLSTTFKQASPAVHKGYEYARSGNPTRNNYEACVAALENAKYGLAFSSGLGATTTLCHMLNSGDHILCMNDVYGGTNRLFSKVIKNNGIETSFVDASDLAALDAAIKPNTKLVWLETPTNPTLRLVDIKGAAEVVHRRPGVVLVVDNTFMSPYFQKPLDLGADVVMHSVTKYLNGHSDAVMGVLMTNNDELHTRLRFLQNAIGAVPSPFDCFLAHRGVKTLHVRMRQHQANAIAVAKFLEASPKVERVYYPGLPSHPQHELAKRQTSGFGGMVTFAIKGDLATAKRFLETVKIFTLAESLGAVESLCELPSVMTHASVSKEQRDALGITDSLVRLSVGLEDEEDLIADLTQALNAAVPDAAPAPAATAAAPAEVKKGEAAGLSSAQAHRTEEQGRDRAINRKMHETSFAFGDSQPAQPTPSTRVSRPPGGKSSITFS